MRWKESGALARRVGMLLVVAAVLLASMAMMPPQNTPLQRGIAALREGDVRTANAALERAVEVVWPTGERELIGRLEADTLYLLVEGRGLVARRPLASRY